MNPQHKATASLTPEQRQAAELLAPHWPVGRRDKAACALAGGLLRAGWLVALVEAFVAAVAEAAGDEEPDKRVEVVAPTAARIKAKQKATGWPMLAQLIGRSGEAVARELRVRLGLAVTLEQLAAHKAIPADFLRGLGVRDLPLGGVGIPYRDGAGREFAVKARTGLRATDGCRWPKATRLIPYGEDRLEDAGRAGYTVLVEGESDCWALWLHGFPALGLPGADTVKKALALGHLGSHGKIYVVQEPDAGGEDFVRNVRDRLAELGWSGQLLVVRLDGVKDPSDLHKIAPDEFGVSFRRALAQAQPLPPGPGEEPWPDPVPLADAPPVPPFPLDVLPERVRRVVQEAADAFPAPPDYVAVPLLVMAGAAIGASRALAVKDGHKQHAALYAAVVGPPGSAKSPALELVVEPAQAAEDAWAEEFEDARQAYQAELDQYEIDLKEWKRNGGGDGRPQAPKRPVRKQMVVEDATAESLVPVLKDNPRGIAVVRDELTAWVQAMNMYREGGKGADRQFFLSAWSGATCTVNRKKTHDEGPLRVRRPFLCVVGGLTPDKLPALREARPRQRAEEDGFIDRVLVTYPPEPPVAEENWRVVSEETLAALAGLFAKLQSLQMVPIQEGGLVRGYRPFVVRLTESGREAWQRFTREHAAERNVPDFTAHLKGPWSKLRGYGARLALILHFLRWACDEVACEDVDGESMGRAARLVEYFKAHARKVYAVMDADPRVPVARLLLRWVAGKGLTRFSRRDAYRALRSARKSVDEVDPVLTLLEKHGFIRPAAVDERPGPGRKASPLFDAHPCIPGQYGQNGQNVSRPRPDPDGAAHSVHSVPCVPGSEGQGQNAEATVGNGATRQAPAAGDSRGVAPGVVVQDGPWPPEGPGVVGGDPTPCAAAQHILVRDPALLASVRAALDESAQVGLDTETTGLDPRTDRLRLLTLATDRGTWVVDCDAVDPAPLFPLLADKPLIGHNLAFDLGFLCRRGFEPGPVRDTMILSQLLHAGRKGVKHRLADCAQREIGVALDKGLQRSDWSGPLSAEQLAYAAADAHVLVPLYRALDEKVRQAGMGRVADLEMRCVPAVAWVADAGVLLDRPAWEALAARAEAERDAAAGRLDGLAPPRPGRLAGYGAWNWNSGDDALELFRALGAELEDTKDETLAELGLPLADALRDYRGAAKRASTYGRKFLAPVAADGRLYVGWRQCGARTGRLSSARPNMQNVPGLPEYRRCFRPRDGCVFVRADYSQIELRLACKIANERVMLAAYQSADADLHALTAKKILGLAEVTKEQRKLAKPVNFGLIYGLGPRSLARKARVEYGVPMTEDEARRYRSSFFGAYPGLAAWHRAISRARATETRTLLGRRVFVAADDSPGKKANYAVQGSGGDGIKEAMALLYERRGEVPGARLVLTVHDELVVEVPAGEARAASAWLRRCMLEAMAPLIDPVPLDVEAEVLRTWGGPAGGP